jgi:hypothetical protein
VPYAAVPRFSVFEFEYPKFCAELRAALKAQGVLSSEDDHFLKDGAEGRHKHATMQRVMRLAALSDKPEHHEMLSELVRPTVRTPAIATAFLLETASNGDANNAQMRYAHAPCKSAWLACRDALMRQMATTRSALDAVLNVRTWQ